MLTVVITGASAGLGRAIAHEFARKARVGLISRDQAALDGTAAEVEEMGDVKSHCCSDAGDEYAAVHMGKKLAPPASPACAANL